MEEEGGLNDIREHARTATTVGALSAVKRRREGFFNEAGCHLEEKRKQIFQRFPVARVLQVHDWGIVFESIPAQRVPLPPVGYAYKGGAARLGLLHALGVESSKRSARDLDLVRITNEADQIDEAVAKKFMGEDAKHGQGVECISSFEEYLSTRDITINEVLYSQDRVVTSHAAINDITNRVLRPTAYALTQSDESKNRISAKIIRFAAEAIISGNPSSEVFFPTTDSLLLFSFLLQLERALSARGRLAETYVREVSSRGLMPDELKQCSSLQDLSAEIKELPTKLMKNFPQVARLKGSSKSKKKGAFRK